MYPSDEDDLPNTGAPKGQPPLDLSEPEPDLEKLHADPPPRPRKRRWLRRILWTLFLLLFIGLPGLFVFWYATTVYPTLPDASELKEVRYQVPLKILTADGKLISEIGAQKRIPLDYTDIPERMTQAIIAAEDENFFSHPGIDPKGLARAVYDLITTGRKKSGGSTITMQVARNFFLSRKKTFMRKLNEIVLALKIEHQLSKPEILALYLNQIFLGHRSYGVGAAAQTYYGKDIHDLTIAEYAMLAGLPKAPSALNPITNPERALTRRNYVLGRMHELGFITDEEFKEAVNTPIHARLSGARSELEASYIAEMARDFALKKFGRQALEMGLTLVTSIDSHLQETANHALREGLMDYERRHGYRGPEAHVEGLKKEDPQALQAVLKPYDEPGQLRVGVVTAVTPKAVRVVLKARHDQPAEIIEMPFDPGMKWARPFITTDRMGRAPKRADQVVKVGDIIYVEKRKDTWWLAQKPQVQGALVSLDSHNGRILALVGGFDYFASKFNRAVQGRRQVGSNIKPFIYSAALDKGFTAASIINDAPVVFRDRALEEVWRPENYSGRFYGPTRLRVALAYSRNLVSIRLLKAIGIRYALKYLERFGFPRDVLQHNANLSLALGTIQLTPLEVVRGFAVFSNQGYLIEPWFVKKIINFDGKPIYEAMPKTACPNHQCAPDDPSIAPQTISPQNAYIMTSMMQDVIRYGSGRRAKAMGRKDIAGKTGTTNDQKDAWFSGFNPHIATTVWVGFDTPATLGRHEVGGRAALPIWMAYMKEALKDEPNAPFPIPEGLVNVPINPKTGRAVPADTPGAIFEVFREPFAPEVQKQYQEDQLETLTQELFE